MIESEIASCPDRPWLRKISLRDRQHKESVPQKTDRIVAVLFTLCDANMAKHLTITIAKHPAQLQNGHNCRTLGPVAKHQAEAGCSNHEMEPSCQS
ncbi:hypothetical protein [Mesorhizobium sp. NZP2298]|jgi:hypothetical protein|uniref:hypothetical protein n=1 Tax=Mesorhizobium sp. NZP2298 TaxID=2483403 RepID=UPI0015544878|nr:hypothetical protein [Mesorhizobium sp. NZP2298]